MLFARGIRPLDFSQQRSPSQLLWQLPGRARHRSYPRTHRVSAAWAGGKTTLDQTVNKRTLQ